MLINEFGLKFIDEPKLFRFLQIYKIELNEMKIHMMSNFSSDKRLDVRRPSPT